MAHSFLLILITLAIVALIDYVPRLFMRGKRVVEVETGRGRSPKFFIMPTVYGDISYLQNVPFLKKYADKVVICTSKYESPAFYKDLEKACKQHGFRYIAVDLPFVNSKPIKNAYTIYKGALSDLDALGAKPDTPCLLIDADTYSHDNAHNLIRTFKKHNLDIVSLRCEVANPQSTIEILQDFEYTLAMDNRRMDPWLTSGACNLAKASVFQHVFAHHSHFFAGGDIEIGKLAQVMRYRVRHVPFTFYTAAPNTFKDWYKQRIIWLAGGFRHHVINIASYGWHHFFMLFYNSLIIYLLLPLRWIELANFPFTLFALIGLSWVYTAILLIGKRRWRPAYLLLPFYSFIQSMIILPVGFVRYIKLAWGQRSLGILHYDLDGTMRTAQILYKSLSISSAILVLYVATAFTTIRIEYWMSHGFIMKLIFK